MIVVGTTLAAFAMSEPDRWDAWLRNADRQRAMAAEAGHDLVHFAALQVDARGIEPFAPLIERLEALGGEWWTYSLDDGRTSVTMTNRWRHITFGQNLVVERCQSDPAVAWLLFLAADCAVPSDIVERMVEMDHPLVAPYAPTYGLRGPKVDRYPFHVEEAMASAAALFMSRDVFRRIRWRWDLDAGMSDDPCFHHDAKALGIPTYVRHDVRARHYPEAIGAYDTRYELSELEVHR